MAIGLDFGIGVDGEHLFGIFGFIMSALHHCNSGQRMPEEASIDFFLFFILSCCFPSRLSPAIHPTATSKLFQLGTFCGNLDRASVLWINIKITP